MFFLHLTLKETCYLECNMTIVLEFLKCAVDIYHDNIIVEFLKLQRYEPRNVL
jgi:hypothetical protein